jgi:hypothetical protein
MIFIDSVFLVALAMPSDSLHQCAMAWSAAIRRPLVTTEYIVWEVVNRLSAPINRAKAHGLVNWLNEQPQIQVVPAEPSWFRAGMALHANRPDKSWSLTDCISFEVMTAIGARQALTFDAHFQQAGFEALMRRSPTQ